MERTELGAGERKQPASAAPLDCQLPSESPRCLLPRSTIAGSTLPRTTTRTTVLLAHNLPILPPAAKSAQGFWWARWQGSPQGCITVRVNDSQRRATQGVRPYLCTAVMSVEVIEVRSRSRLLALLQDESRSPLVLLVPALLQRLARDGLSPPH